MAWIELSLTAFEDGLLADELSALNDVKAREGRPAEEQLTSLLASTSNTVRGYCPPKLSRGAGLTIPDELEDVAVAMARKQYFSDFPELKGLWTDIREQLYLQGIRRLERWAEDKYHCAPATEPAPVAEQATGGGASLLCADPTGWEGYR